MKIDGQCTYELKTCLGQGGFGEVYLAEMTSEGGLPSRVAAKVLRSEVVRDGQALRRLRDEARAMSRLVHPSILKVHDLVVFEGDRVALITEYVEGEDLAACLPSLGLRALAEVLARVAWALDAAWHSPLELVHRDVKPSNVRLSRHGEVKLLDFGIARAEQMTREAQTGTDVLVGSPPYMAPERFLGPAAVPASDVFSLGCVLFEALTGRRPFEMPVVMLAGLAVAPERYQAHLESQLATIPADCPESVRSLVRELLQPEPEARPQARVLAERLERMAEDLPGPTLARFCRDRAWADPVPHTGELSGRVLAEGTSELPPRAGSARAALVALGLGVGGAGGLGLLALLLGLLALWAAGEREPQGPGRAPPSAEPVPGGNQEACLAYVEHYNALPCATREENPRLCDRLDEHPCDHALHYRCRQDNVWCEGDTLKTNFAYSQCPKPCDNRRRDKIGPAERACYDYVQAYNALACSPGTTPTRECRSDLDSMPCDWHGYYACLTERMYCSADGRLGYRSEDGPCRPNCR
jgi:tRNA A-37 threonylcarbamoyl transferase component Bud32